MGWEKEIIIKLIRFLELIGLVLLFLIRICIKILNKAYGIVFISVVVLLVIYFIYKNFNLFI